MSKALLPYIDHSPLFEKKHMESNYRSFTDEELRNHLSAYREHSLQLALTEEKVLGAGGVPKRNLSILPETLISPMPTTSFLAQSALYADEVVVNDPVFGLTIQQNSVDAAFKSLLHLPQSGLDRKHLTNAATYIVNLKRAMELGFIRLSPISYLREPPEQVPITSSPTGFADSLPKELMELFWANVQVGNLRHREGAWHFEGGDLVPGRAIAVHFADIKLHHPYFWFLVQQTYVSREEEDTNEDTTIVHTYQVFPDEPPDEDTFYAWVFQSVNQSARRFAWDLYQDFGIAISSHSTYLTGSSFTAEVLGTMLPLKDSGAADLKTDILNSVLRMDLPILEGVPLDRILDLREKDGEAFQNFRVALEAKLRDLRLVSDPSELARKVQHAAHELSEVQINEIDKKMSTIKKGVLGDIAVLGVGLAATIQPTGLSVPAFILALAGGYKTYRDYISKVRENPMFFLWKLREKQRH